MLSLLARQSAFARDCRYNPCDTCPDDVYQCTPSKFIVGRRYLRLAGTSMSAPFVSGVAALVLSHHPTFTREQVRQALFQSADDLGEPGWDRMFGYGRVDAAAAVSFDDLPVAEITAPINGDKLQQWQLPFTIEGSALTPNAILDRWQLSVVSKQHQETIFENEGRSEVEEGPLGVIGSDILVPGQQYVAKLEVHDADGHVAFTSQEFLVPDLHFAVVPIPAPPENAVDPKLSDSGTLMAFTSTDPTGETAAYFFDASFGLPLRLGPQHGSRSTKAGWFTADGTIMSYMGGLPDGTLCHGVSASGQSTVALNTETNTYKCLLRGVTINAAVDQSGLRGVFVSIERFNSMVDNPPGDSQLFYFDQVAGVIQQLTKPLVKLVVGTGN